MGFLITIIFFVIGIFVGAWMFAKTYSEQLKTHDIINGEWKKRG